MLERTVKIFYKINGQQIVQCNKIKIADYP